MWVTLALLVLDAKLMNREVTLTFFIKEHILFLLYFNNSRTLINVVLRLYIHLICARLRKIHRTFVT